MPSGPRGPIREPIAPSSVALLGLAVQQTPRGPIAKGGLTDRYLSDYPNMHGDLSANSGLNALTRDEAFTRDFLARHQNKLLFGSDCTDVEGRGPACHGAQTIGAIRRLSVDKNIERKLLHDNARKLLPL